MDSNKDSNLFGSLCIISNNIILAGIQNWQNNPNGVCLQPGQMSASQSTLLTGGSFTI